METIANKNRRSRLIKFPIYFVVLGIIKKGSQSSNE